MTARNLPGFRVSAAVWTATLAAAIAFASLEIRALGQAQKPTTPQTATPTTQRPPQGTPPASGGQGANQGTPGNPQGPGRGGPMGSRLSAQRGGPPWWQDEAVKKELGLTAEQVKRLESYFDQRAKELEPLSAEFEKQLAELNRLMSERTVGTAAISLQVARLEVPRARINESFYVMMYRQSRVLTPEQWKKLQDILDRNRDRGRGGH